MTYQDQKKHIHGKLAFKTRDACWLDTDEPIIVVVSINSSFHEKIWGDFKMNALLTTIKQHVRGKITALFAESAHVHANSLWNETFEECLQASHRLQERYASYLENWKIVDWHSYVCRDISYQSSLALLKSLMRENRCFDAMLRKDAEGSYTDERKQKIPDKALFIAKTVDDILEQCAGIMVMANKGYRYLFYPGKSYASVEWIRNSFVLNISWIDVFLTIEKKSFCLTKESIN